MASSRAPTRTRICERTQSSAPITISAPAISTVSINKVNSLRLASTRS